MVYEHLRMKDFILIRELSMARSLRELARRLKLDPQNLTKRLSLIEKSIGTVLIDRSVNGYTITSKGQRVITEVSSLLERIQQLGELNNNEVSEMTRIRLCSRGFLVDHFIKCCLPKIKEFGTFMQFDLMDSSPAITERAARNGLLEVVLHFGILGPRIYDLAPVKSSKNILLIGLVLPQI